MKKLAKPNRLTHSEGADSPQSRRWLVGVVLLLVGAGLGYIITWRSKTEQPQTQSNAAGSAPGHALQSVQGTAPAVPATASQRALFGLVNVPTFSAWSNLILASEPAIQTDGMVWIPAGSFEMGEADPMFPDAKPVHRVQLDGFWMDKTEVTNAQFARFVNATGYRTVAERPPDPKDFPGADPSMLVPGSLVFTPPEGPVSLEQHYSWWRYQRGASWRQPEGPGSSIRGRDNHPVVHVCWYDAVEYAKWASKRLPTEAEWEYAARGGLEQKHYAWGNELQPDGRWMTNIWQGQFPRENTRADGYERTAPAGTYPANGYGLHDMAGNVWEWCSDWYRPDYYNISPRHNPQGPDTSYDPNEPAIPKKAQRGGSFLCSDLYCVRYRMGSRGKGALDSGASHVGFRCVR